VDNEDAVDEIDDAGVMTRDINEAVDDRTCSWNLNLMKT
jgi:hypothetical protein